MLVPLGCLANTHRISYRSVRCHTIRSFATSNGSTEVSNCIHRAKSLEYLTPSKEKGSRRTLPTKQHKGTETREPYGPLITHSVRLMIKGNPASTDSFFVFRWLGVPQDYLLAYFWWSLATTSNTGGGYDYNRCANYRDRAANQLTLEQLMKVQQTELTVGVILYLGLTPSRQAHSECNGLL